MFLTFALCFSGSLLKSWSLKMLRLTDSELDQFEMK